MKNSLKDYLKSRVYIVYTNAGKRYCWGGNTYGQLGNGTSTDSSIPVQVANQFYRDILKLLEYIAAPLQ